MVGDFNLLEFIMGGGILAMGFLLARYVKNSDDNNQRQWDRLDKHSEQINTLETEHRIMKNGGGCRFYHHRKEDEVEK